MTVSRGTSNSNERGNAEQRRKRKGWLFDRWGADFDVITREEFGELVRALRDETDVPYGGQGDWEYGWEGVWLRVRKGLGRPAVRCFRCGCLLDWESVECDRIIPAAQKSKKYPMGGRYQKNNVRPICPKDNKIIAGEEKRKANAKRKATNARRRAARAAAKAHQERR